MSAQRRCRSVDVLVVGAGPAGLAAATALRRSGAGQVEVLEREQAAGGIPRHSHHTGYGLRDLHRVMAGPAYARHHVELAERAGVVLQLGATATGWAGPRVLDVTSPAGLERIEAGAVVLATGARERPRSARLVPGTRPAGVYTTGQLQQAVYLKQQPIGRRAVIVGAEHVSFSAVLTLHHAGVPVAAMITDLPGAQTYLAFRLGAGLRYRFPIHVETAVTRLLGSPRLTGVEVRTGAGPARTIEADTIVFTGNWIPDHELARRGGLFLDPGTRGPAVDTTLQTSVPGVFGAGNLLHPVETADVASLDGRAVARGVLAFLGGEPGRPAVPVTVDPPLEWIAPNRVHPAAGRPPRDRFVLRTRAFLAPGVLTVSQGERVLFRTRHRRLVPNRSVYLDAGWCDHLDPDGPAVRVAAAGPGDR